MTRIALYALIPTIAACTGTSAVDQPDWSGKATDSALIWSGFDHEWQYNHRLNRLGNWVGPLSCGRGTCEAEMAHAAASGLGSDTASWNATATAVHAPGVGFLAGSTRFRFDVAAAEGKYVELTGIAEVPTEGLLADREQYVAVLGGYDVYALDDADMFETLRIEVGEVTVDAEAGKATFPVTFGLQVDCDAFECDGTWDVGRKLDTRLEYGGIVMWQLIAADDEIDVTTIDLEDGYAWEDQGANEIVREDYAIHGSIGASDGYEAALGAVQALQIRIDHESHFVEVATGVSDLRWDAAAGRVDYTVDLFFKQWNAATAARSTSYTTPGEAETAATIALVRFRDASVERIDASGQVAWVADGSTATDERAVDRQAVSFDLPETK